MPDNLNTSASNVRGQDVKDPNQGTGESDQSKEFVTKAELADAEKRAEEAAFRRAQGLYTKSSDRMKELEASWKELEAKGITISDASKEAQRQDVLNSDQPPGNAQAGKQEVNQPQGLDPITSVAMDMQKQRGVFLEDGDPELSMVKTDGTPWEYFQSIDKALTEKTTRLDKQKATDSMGKTPGMGHSQQAGSPFSGKKGLELFSTHFKDKGG